MRWRGWTRLLAVVLFSATLQAQAPGVLEQVAVYPTLIVYNARIYTMDKALSSHQAMALRDNRIWRLGTDQEIRKLAGPSTKLIDAKGRAVVPGLIDAHTQPQLWGALHWGFKYDPQLQWLYVEGATLPELKSRLEERVLGRIHDAGTSKWIVRQSRESWPSRRSPAGSRKPISIGSRPIRRSSS